MKCACGCSSQEQTTASLHQHSATCGCAEAVAIPAGLTVIPGSSEELDGSDGDDPPHSGQTNSEPCGCSASQGDTHDEEDACGCGCDHDTPIKRYEKISLILAGVFLAIALAGEYILGNELILLGGSFLSIAAGLVIVFPETINSLKAKSIDINVLMVVAVIGAVYVQSYEEAAAVLFLFSIGNYLEGRAVRKSNDAIKDLAKLAPETALVLRDGKQQEVSTDQVNLGETIFLKPGMSVALDGIITKGSSSFNDAAITGESIPVLKSVGDKVYAASLALDGSCEFETTSTVKNSTLAKIAEMVDQAQKQKSERETFVQRFAKVYTPLVIVAAFLVALIPPMITSFTSMNLGDFNTWIYRACELLVISCPCAFVISTPVTIVSALTRAAKLGILVKGGAYFEEGARTKVVAFDKTGTLTEGKPEVIATITAEEAANEPSLLAISAALEQHSTHPLAQAVTNHAQREGLYDIASAEDVHEQAGKGITGTIKGASYCIGSVEYLSSNSPLSNKLTKLFDVAHSYTGTTLYVARITPSPEVLGVLIVADKIRTDTAKTISALHKAKQQIKTVMLTGDNQKTAEAIAHEAGVTEVHASLLPKDKTTQVQRLRETYGTIAFVGDGINDAPSIASANVGIAMGGAGSDAALSSSDVVLMANDISALPKFFNLSTRTIAILRQNIVLALGLKALVALLVVVGVAQMWMAVAADSGVALLVILNGMRLMRVKLS